MPNGDHKKQVLLYMNSRSSSKNTQGSMRSRVRKLIMLIRVVQMFSDTVDLPNLSQVLIDLTMCEENPFKNQHIEQQLKDLYRLLVKNKQRNNDPMNMKYTKTIFHQLCPPFNDNELKLSVHRDQQLQSQTMGVYSEMKTPDDSNLPLYLTQLLPFFQRMYYWYGYFNESFAATRYVCDVLDAFLSTVLHQQGIIQTMKSHIHPEVWTHYFEPLVYVLKTPTPHGFEFMENSEPRLWAIRSQEELSEISFYQRTPTPEDDPIIDMMSLDNAKQIAMSITGHDVFNLIMEQLFVDITKVPFTEEDQSNILTMFTQDNQPRISIDKWRSCLGFLRDMYEIRLVILVISISADGVTNCVPIGYNDPQDFERCAVAIVLFGEKSWSSGQPPLMGTLLGYNKNKLTDVSVSGLWSHDAFKKTFTPLYSSITESGEESASASNGVSITMHFEYQSHPSDILYSESGNKPQI